ncbi:alpha/beta hydrolase family protein [Galbibacter sp.]|uniref:alpha/beta hydrolase family protein n=1 Tax=Galbibacter sp. TaxID=2918471 RepID=UPI003A9371FF
MKHKLLMILVAMFAMNMYAQDLTGQWNGVLKVQGVQLRLVFNVAKSDNGYSSTMDSPDQGANGIPVTSTTFENSTLQFVVSNAGIQYTGVLVENKFVGTFKQGGMELPLNLSRDVVAKENSIRPQEPKEPFPYYSEDVTFINKEADISLSGTLTLPSKVGKFPVVILISGSGPQNRDQELFGHKPFLVISDYLTKKGIAVLRYDDRGVGQSSGEFKTATTVDFATDVESAIAYLKTRKEINKNKIGLIGHSEGGIIAPLVASKSKDVSFIVLLAGTGIPGDQLLLRQQQAISKAGGVSGTELAKSLETSAQAFELIAQSNNDQTLKEDLTKLLEKNLERDITVNLSNGMTKEEFISAQVEQISSPWTQYFVKYDPATALEKVKCPVLAVIGEKDLQVPAKENLEAISNALKNGGNKEVTTKVFPGLNHLFQECETGLPMEYANINQTFSPTALLEITEWIIKQAK